MSLENVLIDFCESNEFEYRTDYSGRGMYGKQCFGIICDYPLDIIVILVDVIRDCEEFENAFEISGSPKIDSMGLSQILYFPKVMIK